MKKERKKNKIGLIIIIVLILFILGIGVYFAINKLVPNKDNNQANQSTQEPENTEEIYNYRQDVIADKEVDGITFTNIDCYWDGENTIISYTITNTTNESINIGKYKIEAYDDTGTLIYNLSPYLDKKLEPNEEYEELISTADNLSKVYSIKISLNN